MQFLETVVDETIELSRNIGFQRDYDATMLTGRKVLPPL